MLDLRLAGEQEQEGRGGEGRGITSVSSVIESSL